MLNTILLKVIVVVVSFSIILPTCLKNDRQIFSLSLRFNDHFAGGSGLAGTRMSPFWILLELRVMEVAVTNAWSYKTFKAPVKIVATNKPTPSFFTGQS